MSAERLREAAALMRSRAEAALVEPWRDDGGRVSADVAGYGIAAVCHAVRKSDATHIASWHPAVALVVADWLEVEAEAVDFQVSADPTYRMRANDEALAVANAYLGAPA